MKERAEGRRKDEGRRKEWEDKEKGREKLTLVLKRELRDGIYQYMLDTLLSPYLGLSYLVIDVNLGSVYPYPQYK